MDHKDVVTLLENGLGTEEKDNDGWTALHTAVRAGSIDVVDLLLKKGGDKEARTNHIG